MKNILGVIFLGMFFNTNAQDSSVEKSIFGIQTGFMGIWLNNEIKLTNNITLRSEIGIENDFSVGNHYEGAGFIIQPVLTLEPRYYYNLIKRNTYGKNIYNNSGNYISIKTSYHPDWYVLNLDENITKTADLSIIPTWGIKRQIVHHFTYETGLGLGVRIVYLKPYYFNGNAQNVDDSPENKIQYVPYLNLRIGYVF
ncbi:hypothetical protein FNW25_04775 [Flavobacterium franklandianum]|nr:hypothetical protein [Flavobacterium franklandianum]TRX28709.1 hypothetical protein FNW25_04775 [Flavobacterium franklandianum]